MTVGMSLMEQGGMILRVQEDMILRVQEDMIPKDQGDKIQTVQGDMIQMVQGGRIQRGQGDMIQMVRGDKMIPGGRGDRWKVPLEEVALSQSQYHLQQQYIHCKCKAKTTVVSQTSAHS